MLEAASLPGVQLAEPMLNVACTFENGHFRHKGGVTGLQEGATLTVPRDTQARPIRVPSIGLAMSAKLAEILHLKPGDMVTVHPTKGLRHPRKVPVVEISDSYMGTSVYTDIEYLSRLIGEEFALNGVQLKMDTNPDEREAFNRQLKRLPAVRGAGWQRGFCRWPKELDSAHSGKYLSAHRNQQARPRHRAIWGHECRSCAAGGSPVGCI